MKAGNVFSNPLYHFNAYGLGNPTVLWALEHGLYEEWCPECRGAGFVIIRPSGCVTDLPAGSRKRLPKGTHRGSESCPECRADCRLCRGERIRPDRQICAQDFGDEASLEVARKYLSTRHFAKGQNFYERQLR